MFSNIMEEKYKKQLEGSDSKLIPAFKLEQLIHEDFGYAFNRLSLKSMKDTWLWLCSSNDVEDNGNSTRYSINAALDVLCYILLSESLMGMSGRGNAKSDRNDIIKSARLGASFSQPLRRFVYNYDILQCNVPDDSPDGWAPEDYDASLHRARPLPLSHRLNISYYFFYNWLTKNQYDNFYEDWKIFRNRVLCEDPLAKQETNGKDLVFFMDGTPKMEDFKKDVSFSIPFYNKYESKNGWSYGKLEEITSCLTGAKGASLTSSIVLLDSFIKNNPGDVSKLMTWMEIILTFENGTGWITEEAKAKLSQDTSLDIDSIISDWWLLSIIYLHTLQKKLG